jgi:hypothetical protein
MSATPQPVVLFGFPRSGTTVLSRVFDAHPEVSCPPETNLLAACGRFLRESEAEGPPLGVLSGLALAGVGEDVVHEELRGLIFRLHARLAGGKPIWMEKSGFDIFYVEELERLLASHCRFICIRRHPLDVVVSVRELVDKAGHYMAELHAFLRRYENPYQAFAAAWMDRADAVDAFLARHPDRCFAYRYEDLIEAPATKIAEIAAFLGVAPPTPERIDAAFTAPSRIGLGDWKVFERSGIDRASVGRWRQALPRGTAARLIPALAPYLERYGYPVPKPPRIPDRAEALRQFDLAKRMQLSSGRKA